jgi:hypothetical protein
MRNGDIRNWTSPLRTPGHQPQQAPPDSPLPEPPRRRIRIVESDDDEQPQRDNAEEVMINPPQSPHSAAVQQPSPQHAEPAADVVHVDTSESEDIYLLLPQSDRPPEDQLCGEGLPSPATSTAHSRRYPVRASRRRRFEASAEETSAVDDSSECVETDTGAQDLYRDAILGIRNARNARAQLRSSTAPCPVCALFAAFIRHYM